MHMQSPKIAVVGGGTGTSVVLEGLKQTKKCQLYAIVVVSDSGGSTGRLRDEFGFLPVGDLRQCLASLADGKQQDDIRKLLLYRFNKGNGLIGHNLGNLILTALEDIKASPGMALETASQIFKTAGSVYPIAEKTVDLVIEYEDGTIKIGEAILDDPKNGGKKIKRIKLSPKAKIYVKAKQALLKANLIIIGPGDLYASILPNTLVKGFSQTIKQTKAKIVYVVNLMTHYSQTHNMTALDHVNEITKYCQRKPDYIILNTGEFPKTILSHYAKFKEYPVTDDLNSLDGGQVIKADFLSKIVTAQHPSDTIIRSLIRHDSKKLAKVILKLL